MTLPERKERRRNPPLWKRGEVRSRRAEIRHDQPGRRQNVHERRIGCDPRFQWV